MMTNSKPQVQHICGVDEVGRGAWAGPVVAAAVVLTRPIAGLADSKALNVQARHTLAQRIQANSLWAIGVMSELVIDELNILQATMRAMEMAVMGLSLTPNHILVDGNQLPKFSVPATAIIKGDQREPSIQAASILAKVARDQLCVLLDGRYPGYGFAQHKGYGTKAHKEALMVLGVSPVHRKSYRPVAMMLQGF